MTSRNIDQVGNCSPLLVILSKMIKLLLSGHIGLTVFVFSQPSRDEINEDT